MAILQQIRCDFCGKVEYGYNGPVEPVNPARPPANDPPGSGFYTLSGPSFGMGFPPTGTYCSKEHVISAINGETPPAQPQSDPPMKGWKARSIEKRGRNA